MNKFFILFLFVTISAHAQSGISLSDNKQTYSPIINADSLAFSWRKSVLNNSQANRATIVPLFIVDTAQTVSLCYITDRDVVKFKSSGQLIIPEFISESQKGDTAILNGYLKRDGINNYFITNRSLVDAIGLSKQTKPTYSDYVILPNGKGSGFEFRDHEVTTTSGSTVDLNTMLFSATYSSALPATSNNGGSLVQQAVYKETIIGSGKNPWYVAEAPSKNNADSIQINTSANLSIANYDGAFKINTPENTFEVATSDSSGKIGWVKNIADTKLILSAGFISMTGQLVADGSISSRLGLMVGDSTATNVNISPTSIFFANNDSNKRLSIETSNNWNGALVLNSNSPGGIVLNTIENNSLNEGAILFAVNSNVIGHVTANGLVIGNGEPNSSSILSLFSHNQAFLPPTLTDDEIFNIPNPIEGMEVYSKEHHTPLFYNGNDWMKGTRFKKLKKPKKLITE